MKTAVKFLALILLGMSLLFSSCRKGEDDPFLSFRSRNARLSGDWKLDAAKFRREDKLDQKIVATTYTFEGNVMTGVQSQLGFPNYIGTSTYREFVTFEKDGTYNMKIISDSENSTTSGNWMWLYENDEIDLANKEAVAMTVTKDSDGNMYSGKSNPVNLIWVFKELSNKKIVVEIDQEVHAPDGSGFTLNGTFTYIQD